MQFDFSIFRAICLLVMLVGMSSCSSSDDDTPREENIRLKIFSMDSNEVEITYNEDGKVSSIGRDNVIYDAEGRIKQNGNTSYTYNNQGRVSKMTRRSGSRTIETTIVYNNEGLVATSNSMDDQGKVSRSTFEYDSKNRLTILISENTNFFHKYVKTSLTYDAKDNIEQILTEDSDDGILYNRYNVENYTYDVKNSPNYNLLTKTGHSIAINLFNINPSLRIGNYNAYETMYFYSKNNLLSSQVFNSSGTSIYDYVYNENNYPFSVEIENTYSTEPEDDYIGYRTWTYENF